MDLPTILSALAVLAAIGVPMLARRDVLTKLEERDRIRDEWRQEFSKKVDALADNRQNTEFVRMKAMDEAREKAWWVWRDDVGKRLGEVDNAPYRLTQLEHYHEEYRLWKHERVDPYISDYAALEKRVSRCERVLNGKLNP